MPRFFSRNSSRVSTSGDPATVWFAMPDGVLQPGLALSLHEGVAIGAAGIDHPGGIAELEGADAALEQLQQGGAFASGAAEGVHGGDYTAAISSTTTMPMPA
jgi:hypothetical protein